MEIELRPLEAAQPQILQDVWLRALADTPDAFGVSFAEMAAQPAAYWSDLARSLAASDDQQVVIAYAQDRPCGLIHGSIETIQREVAHIGAVWVDPAVRRQGIAKRLLQTIASWAQARGARRLELWVMVGNAAAMRHYMQAGFRATGRQRPLPSDTTLQICQMERDL